jgi:hypothetical protein
MHRECTWNVAIEVKTPLVSTHFAGPHLGNLHERMHIIKPFQRTSKERFTMALDWDSWTTCRSEISNLTHELKIIYYTLNIQ